MWTDPATRSGLAAIALTLGLVATSCAGGGHRADVIEIAFVTDCKSPLAAPESSVAGAELPFLRRGAKLHSAQPSSGVTGATVGGKRAQLLVRCESYPNFATLIGALRQVVENDGADIVVGPSNTGEGFVVKKYAKEHPEVTFLTRSAEQTTTLKDPLPNVFGFEADSAQASAGLGAYAYRALGWRNAVTVGENDPAGWAEVAGFAAEFCSLGGHIVKPQWSEDFRSIARLATKIPSQGVDGIVLPSPFLPARSFMSAWSKRHPHFGGQLLVNADSDAFDRPLRRGMLGLVGVSSSPLAPTAEARRFDAASAHAFPDLRPDLSSYGAMESVLEALGRVQGDLSDGERRFQQALARLRFSAPNGPRSLDQRRQAIAPTYLREVERSADGRLVVRQIAVVRDVEQTFGGYFTPATPSPSRHPLCRHRTPPAWVSSIPTTR